MLFVDGKHADRKHMDHITRIMFPEDEDFDIGMDTRTGVAPLDIVTIVRSCSPARSIS